MRLRLGLVVLYVAGNFVAGCSTVNSQLTDVLFIPNPNSDKRNNAVVLDIAYSTKRPCDPRSTATIGKCEDPEKNAGEVAKLVAGTPFESAADMAGNLIKDALADEAKRYTADFSAAASGSQFYHLPVALAINEGQARNNNITGEYEGTFVDKTNVKFAGFRLERQLDPESRDSKSKEEVATKTVAMRICAIAVPSLNDEFISVIPVSYAYRFSKAKLLGFSLLSPFGVDLLNPWEIVTNPLSGEGFDLFPADRDLDVTMNVSFEHLYYDTSGTLTSKATPEQMFRLPAVRITGKEVWGYFPEYLIFLNEKQKKIASSETGFELRCDHTATPEKIAAVRDKFLVDVAIDDADRMKLESSAKPFQAARRAFNFTEGKRGNAFFTLNVRVTEVDDFGARMTTINEKLEDKKGKGVIDTLTSMLPAQ